MIVVALIAAVSTATFTRPTAAGYDVYAYSQDGTAIPDVNKPGDPNLAPWPDPNDKTCWLAAAANLLGAADWGTGANAQAKADSIYSQLRTMYGTGNPGPVEVAVHGWLAAFGLDPNKPEYDANNKYNNVTVVQNLYGQPLLCADYDRALSRLAGTHPYTGPTQYLAARFLNPREGDEAHWLTLVGGDRDPNCTGTKTAVWHDSDRNLTRPGDDPYTISFPVSGWALPNYDPDPNLSLHSANKYTVLNQGLGLVKLEPSLLNYHLTRLYCPTGPGGSLVPDWYVSGQMADVYPPPQWQDDCTVVVGNEPIADNSKEIYLLVDYGDEDPGRIEDVRLHDDAGREWLPQVEASPDGGQLLFHWVLDYQPSYEEIVLPDPKYRYLTEDVLSWTVAAICVPEPASAALLLLGAAGCLVRPRRTEK